MKICKDCKHYRGFLRVSPICKKTEHVGIADPVTGEEEPASKYCDIARMDRGDAGFEMEKKGYLNCGPSGKYWEAKK